EDRSQTRPVGKRQEGVPTQSEVQRQPPGRAPVVLNVRCELVALGDPGIRGTLAQRIDPPQEKIGGSIAGKSVDEGKTRVSRTLEPVHGTASVFKPDLHLVGAVREPNLIGDLPRRTLLIQWNAIERIKVPGDVRLKSRGRVRHLGALQTPSKILPGEIAR